MTLKGGTSHACAACKYQRRKCTSECQLAPYFPANKPEMFRNAHKLFGVRNIIKILEKLDPNQRQEAMHSIIWQANIRDLYPVDGCYGFIIRLYNQIRRGEAELHAIHAQLQMYHHQHHHHHGLDAVAPDMVPSSHLELGMAPPTSNGNSAALALFGHNPAQEPYVADGVMAQLPSSATLDQHQQQFSYSVSSNHNHVGGYSSGYFDVTKDNNNNNNNNNVAAAHSFWLHHSYGINNNNNNNVANSSSSMGALQSPLLGAQPLGGIQQEVVQDYDEIHPFFDTIDDRQSYAEAYDTSSEESVKDTTQSLEQHAVAEEELKSAAACFSLTSVN